MPFFFSPLEQFNIFTFSINIFNWHISFTNLIYSIFIMLTSFFFFIFFMVKKNIDNDALILTFIDKEYLCFYKVIPGFIQMGIETFYDFVLSLVKDNISSKEAQQLFPFVFFIFLFILILNIFGLIPYNFSITSHLIVAVWLSFGFFIGANFFLFTNYGVKALGLFLPSGTNFILALLLVPIEIISYVFRPISLAIRLFANIMAGHTLLKIFSSFACAFVVQANIILAFFYFFPAGIIIPLFFLEFVISLIQAFVFSTLVCIYLNDAVELHSH